MATSDGKLLIYGYGNPGRGDDGLGPALAAALEDESSLRVTVDANYQLSVEDAEELAQHDAVIFVDADVSGPEPFQFVRVVPDSHLSFSSHSVAPGALLALAGELFNKEIDGYILAIRGYEFNEYKESLSFRARQNLEEAVRFMKRAMEERQFDEYLRRYGLGISRTC